MNEKMFAQNEIKEGLKEDQLNKAGDRDPKEVAARKFKGLEKVTEIAGIKIINRNRLPQEIVDEALEIAKEAGKCYFDSDDQGEPTYETPISVTISEYHPAVGIYLKIIRKDGLEMSTSISPSKTAEWEKHGILI